MLKSRPTKQARDKKQLGDRQTRLGEFRTQQRVIQQEFERLRSPDFHAAAVYLFIAYRLIAKWLERTSPDAIECQYFMVAPDR
jgi:hypothetical protein